MNKSLNNIIIIFELKNKDMNSFEYTFHSISSILEKDDNDFIVETGKLSGLTSGDLDKIYADSCLLTNHLIDIDAIINNPTGKFKPSKYAFYKVPKETWEYIKEKKLNSSEALLYLCLCSSTISFMWSSDCNYNIVRNNKNLELLKQSSNNSSNNFEKAFKMINPNNLSIMTKVNENSYDFAIKSKEDKKNDINVNTIIKDIKNKFVSQDDAIESIVANIYANQILLNSNDKDLISSQKASILIEGPTGTGKTAIMNEVSNKFGLPIVITSSTEYSSTGYVGSSLTDILVKLLNKSNGDLELAQRGIICIDEFDKLAQEPGNINKLALKTAVQQELLAFIGGAKFDITYKGKDIEFDTTNITFVGIGAFTDIRDRKLEEIKKAKNIIGFENSSEEISSYIISEQDYIDYGLQRELIGRFTLLTSTKSYTIEDYKNILLNSTISPLKQFIKFVSVLGIEKVIYSDEFIASIAIKAYEMNFGVRGLQKIISNLKNLLLLNIINNEHNSIELNTDMLEEIEKKKVKSIK